MKPFQDNVTITHPKLNAIYMFACVLNVSLWISSHMHTAICHSGCLHGNCIGPDSCTCDSGWTGDTCNTGKGYV